MKVRKVATFATLVSILSLVQGSSVSGAKTATSTSTSTTVAGPVAVGQVVIDGKGFGHGVGLAQDGALWMGKNGKSAKQILALFFPGTALGKRGGAVRVPLSSVGTLTVVLPNGGKLGELDIPAGTQLKFTAANGVVSVIRVGSSDPLPVALAAPGKAARVKATRGRAKARFISASAQGLSQFLPRVQPTPQPPASSAAAVPVPVEPTSLPDLVVPSTVAELPSTVSTSVPTGESSSTVPSSTVTAPSTTIVNPNQLVAAPTVVLSAANGGVSVIGSKKYRGMLEFTAASSGMRVVNELDVEQYLRGMGEVLDPRWPSASLQSQTIVARTYALRLMATKGEVCPTQRCQVYLGAQAEYPAMDAAVVASAGKVVTYEGQLAATFYSASGGGTIADPSEIWGPSTPIPYLKAGTYPIDDPKPWRVEMSLVELGRRIGYPGTLYDTTVSQQGPSGRATVIDLIGSAGVRSLAGPRFDAALGLKSTNFTIVVGRSTDPVGSLPSGPWVSGVSSVSSGSVALAFDGENAFENDLFADIPIPALAPGDSSAGSSTTTTTLPVGEAPTVAPTSAPKAALTPQTSPPTSTRSLTTEATGSGASNVELAAGVEPATQSTLPPWAGWSALGGSALGALWLALRWALRTEDPRTQLKR